MIFCRCDYILTDELQAHRLGIRTFLIWYGSHQPEYKWGPDNRGCTVVQRILLIIETNLTKKLIDHLQ